MATQQEIIMEDLLLLKANGLSTVAMFRKIDAALVSLVGSGQGIAGSMADLADRYERLELRVYKLSEQMAAVEGKLDRALALLSDAQDAI